MNVKKINKGMEMLSKLSTMLFQRVSPVTKIIGIFILLIFIFNCSYYAIKNIPYNKSKIFYMHMKAVSRTIGTTFLYLNLYITHQ